MKKLRSLKKGLAILLAIVMVVGLVPGVGTMKVSAAGITTTKPSGEGTTNSPYQIRTAGELYWFAAKVNGGDTGINAVLTDDITVNSGVLKSDGSLADNTSDFTSWTPIGYHNSDEDEIWYTGTFNGQGHTISGLYFNDKNCWYTGLFGMVENTGTVSNVGVVDSYFSGGCCVGSVCGWNYGTIANCYNTGKVSFSGSGDNNYSIGGVCGQNDGTIANCYNTGDVSLSGSDDNIDYIGGVCGCNCGRIANCYNTGDVSFSDSLDYAGGVCAYIVFNGTMENCYNTGDVSFSGSDSGDYLYIIGGVFGLIQEGTTANCYNTGKVSGSGDYVGGVCGYKNSGTIANCYYRGDCNGENTTFSCHEGISKTNRQFGSGEVAYLLSQGCKVGGTTYDGSVWGQKLGDNADAYPVLKKTGDEGNTVYRNTEYSGCSDSNPGDVTYAYANEEAAAVYAAHSYVNGVCSVCGAVFETTVNGITYKVVIETGTDGKPVGKLVTVSGVQQVAVAVTGTGEDFSVFEGKVTVPSEITGSGFKQHFVVTKISENAFKGASVTEIVVPATVTEVGNGAFGSATTITFSGTTVPEGIAEAISETVTTINVPEEAADRYREALGDSVTIVKIHTHTFDTKWTYDDTYHWHAATCGHEEEIADKTEHTWDVGKVTKEATETAEGVKTYTCSVCGKTKTEVIPKKPATTPQPPKKGDVVVDDKASAKVKVVNVKKKEVTYMAPPNKKAKTVTIPETVKIDGVTYKVIGIADNAFKNNKTVTKVTIGSNIKNIGKNAFYKCTKLKTVKIGKNVTEIGANAFKGCSSLTVVTLGSKTTKIGANAFNGCKKLKTIKITSTKLTSKTVAKNAFKGLTKGETIKVPKKKLSVYKKLFKSKGLSSKATVKGY